MTRDAQAVCDQLRAAIVRTGWSKTSQLTGVERCSLHRAFPAKRGRRVPSFVTVSLVAQALGFTLNVVQAPPNG